MIAESLRSIDLHLNYPPGEVVEVEKLIDVAAGMYPCYYTQTRDSVLVSTSVIKLIDNLGSFKKDPEFQPPEYLRDTAVLENYRTLVPNSVENAIGFVGPFLRQLGLLSSSRWDAQANTIDKRISRLQPFEIVTASNIQQEFTPTYGLDDKKEFVHRSAEYITNFVNEVEKQYPDYEHVIRMGGKDSQLISLVPKISDNWSIFSADPNYEIVEEFVERNNIKVNNIFHNNNENTESREQFIRKVIASDLKADPRHQRWYPHLKKIADRFDGKCIYWLGTEGDTINSYHREFHGSDDYFNAHFNRAANWQAITHQVTKNFTGVPALSPYHSEEIWRDVYQHYDPSMISQDTDLRPLIGEELFGDNVWWPDHNPGPVPYRYVVNTNCYDIYLCSVISRTEKYM